MHGFWYHAAVPLGLALGWVYLELCRFGWRKRAEELQRGIAEDELVRARHRRAYEERMRAFEAAGGRFSGPPPDAVEVVLP